MKEVWFSSSVMRWLTIWVHLFYFSFCIVIYGKARGQLLGIYIYRLFLSSNIHYIFNPSLIIRLFYKKRLSLNIWISINFKMHLLLFFSSKHTLINIINLSFLFLTHFQFVLKYETSTINTFIYTNDNL
jgi:hypothetical protein